MRKAILFSILGIILLASLAIGATIINKNLTIDKTLYDWASADAKASKYTFSYIENEMSDGTVEVCVEREIDSEKRKIGCKTVDSKLVEETEKEMVEMFLEIEKAQSEKPKVDKEIAGELILTP